MKRKREEKEGSGLKMLIFYGILVFFLVAVSFAIRIFSLVKESKFDGTHRFTILIAEESRVFGLISFEPMTSSLSLLTFSSNSNLSFSNFNSRLGIVPDGYIKKKNNLVLKDSVPSIIQSFLFRPNSISTNINLYDLSRLYLYAKRVPESSMVIEEASVSSDLKEFNKTVVPLLVDNIISSENISIEVINAAGKSGLGGRLERVISNLGGNVISVKTAMTTESFSKIQYTGVETYTLRKLVRLLPMKRELLKKESIAKITIIIGEDKKDTSLF